MALWNARDFIHMTHKYQIDSGITLSKKREYPLCSRMNILIIC